MNINDVGCEVGRYCSSCGVQTAQSVELIAEDYVLCECLLCGKTEEEILSE